jgi:hypothetical protein
MRIAKVVVKREVVLIAVIILRVNYYLLLCLYLSDNTNFSRLFDKKCMDC